MYNVHTYTIQRILGAGGMGCVFLAQNRLQKKSVVIKCFWEMRYGSPDVLFNEAFLMAEIAGKYVPQPLDCGFVDLIKQERGYFVSEYIEGTIDGESWLAKYGKLDVTSGIAVGLQIAKGLQLAHDKGIFHLDLKPANILLQRQDEILVKIIDFGLAKVAPSLGQEMASKRSHSGLSLLAQAAVFGTMDYAPPEQQGMTLYGEPSAKSDVYAFGKTLYRLLTGENPQTLHPRRLANAPELFELLCDCVELEPEKRIDVANLMEGLQGLLSPNIQAQFPKVELVKQPPSPKPVEKPIQAKQARIVQIDKREWWNQLNDWWNQLDKNWKKVFKKAICIESNPSDSDLEKIVNLPELDCSNNKISDLEPLRSLTNLQQLSCYDNNLNDLEPLCALTNLQQLSCEGNKISDLEPLHALTNLQDLNCSNNKISDLEPLHALTNLQDLNCSNNKISDLEPLHALTNLQQLSCYDNNLNDLEPLRALTNLQQLWCWENKISDLELDKFKKAVPNCEVNS